MPQVLAIVDPRVNTGCADGTAPVVVGTITDQSATAGDPPFDVATATAFSGTGIT